MLKLTNPRDGPAGHHGDVARARTADNTTGTGGVLPYEEFGGYVSVEGEATVLSSGNVLMDTLGFLPMATSGIYYVAA